MATPQRATTARRCRACCRGFKLGSRVDTRSDCLLQLFDRRCSLRSGLAQVGAAVGRIRAPLAVTAQVEQATIGQLERFAEAASAGTPIKELRYGEEVDGEYRYMQAIAVGAGKQTILVPASALEAFGDAFKMLKGRA